MLTIYRNKGVWRTRAYPTSNSRGRSQGGFFCYKALMCWLAYEEKGKRSVCIDANEALATSLSTYPR
jgi:hypothetical protein